MATKTRTPRPRRPSTAAGVSKLPNSAFAYPKSRKFPINTKARARNALARASHSGNAGTYTHVAKAVRRKWGNSIKSVSRKHGTVTRPGLKKRGRR
jgi:hypothetical protein